MFSDAYWCVLSKSFWRAETKTAEHTLSRANQNTACIEMLNYPCAAAIDSRDTWKCWHRVLTKCKDIFYLFLGSHKCVVSKWKKESQNGLFSPQRWRSDFLALHRTDSSRVESDLQVCDPFLCVPNDAQESHPCVKCTRKVPHPHPGRCRCEDVFYAMEGRTFAFQGCSLGLQMNKRTVVSSIHPTITSLFI